MNNGTIKDKIIDFLQIFGGIALWIFIGIFIFGGKSNSQFYSEDTTDNSAAVYASRVESAFDHWEEVMAFISGSETLEACTDSGCYDLDADISDGYIETIYFNNGGYIQPDAAIDSEGYAEGYSGDGEYWEFYIDVDSFIIQDAISDWSMNY